MAEPMDMLSYPYNPETADEVFSKNGQINPHWSGFMETLQAMKPDSLKTRTQKIQHLLRDDGATYNIHESPDHSNQAWRLDTIPHLINSDHWSTIESGLLERAELYNLLLTDIYNERTIIKHGVIPPEALFAHRGFLRSCHGIPMPGEHNLIFHSVDMIRNSDGDMVVIADNTQSPNSVGYALENRTVLSRTFPSLFRDSHVHRLATFFQRLRQKLITLPETDEQPRIVILSTGTHDASYFEQVYLANYMGFSLVQSSDLMVRGGYLWMKSLDGLKRIDVVFRSVNDSFCDPVELRSDSHPGTAGLLEVVRNGNLIMANPLGSGILGNPIFYKFLPAISKHFLGRELRLATAPTYWCRDENDMQYIARNFHNLIIKPILPGRYFRGVLCSTLTEQGKCELLQRIKEKPYNYIAQEHIQASHVPCFIDDQLQSRASILRSFAVASESSYIIMPGALSQINKEASDTQFISLESGAFSKDTWVIATESTSTADTHQRTDAEFPVAGAQKVSLSSRVAENLFWSGRYAERAEAGLRIIRTLFTLMNSEEDISEKTKYCLLKAITEITATYPGFTAGDESLFNNPDQELRQVINDNSRSGSIRSTLNALLYSSDKSKELLSLDTIRVINNIRDSLNTLDTHINDTSLLLSDIDLEPLITDLLALSGLCNESVRNIGWRFMDIGKRVERTLQTTTLINVLFSDFTQIHEQEPLLKALLLSLELLIPYRRRYRSQYNLANGLDLVVLDNTNPRSLLFQLETLEMHIKELPKTEQTTKELPAEERILLEGLTSIKLSQLSQLLATETYEYDKLKQFLAQLERVIHALSHAISDKYFDHSLYPQQLVNSEWDE